MAARRPTKIQLAKLEAQWELGEYLGMFSFDHKALIGWIESWILIGLHLFLASGGCGTVMKCTKLDDPWKKEYILKYINLSKYKSQGTRDEDAVLIDRQGVFSGLRPLNGINLDGVDESSPGADFGVDRAMFTIRFS